MIFRHWLSIAALAAGLAHAAEIQPYQPDEHTLHLWHLDETQVPFEDAANPPIPLLGLLNGARPGQPGLPGMGSSISFLPNSRMPGSSALAGPILTAKPVVLSGKGDNVDGGFKYFGPDGAFTFEMLVKLDILPKDAPVIALGLISMDGDSEDRVFNCRIEKEGFLSFIPLQNSGANGGALATIPTSGPHALDTRSWFHVAITYDGNDAVANNLKLYWTKISALADKANRIGSGTLSSDLNGTLGDLAIGNEARTFQSNCEAEPFPGLIDEVRISSVARQPSDFLFVPPASRVSPELAAAIPKNTSAGRRNNLQLASVLVDGRSAKLPPKPGDVLQLSSGLHRLDFNFGFDPESIEGTVKLRCQLVGIDERWRETELGMSMMCQAIDANGSVISQFRFPAIGQSRGWESGLEDSTPTSRAEPVYLPGGTAALQITLSSGTPDTTGQICIENILLTPPENPDASFWRNGKFTEDLTSPSPGGTPVGWARGGSDPAIARLAVPDSKICLALIDTHQSHHGEWTAVQQLQPLDDRGSIYILSWDEIYNVIGSSLHRATYVNVPSGSYTFRAMGSAGDKTPIVESISLPLIIHPPFWRRVWFIPLVVTIAAAFVTAALVARHRQLERRRTALLEFQNALESDRTRIARDMHDDLGTRVTVLNMSATLAERDMGRDPEKTRRHLSRITSSARELVVAMDDLVWAVDPAYDSLDDLASHITGLADEIFHDSPIRCRLDIPARLPSLPLGPEIRHHVALAVREAMHNALQHAGPCEVFVSLAFDGEQISITIRDTGVGFDIATDDRGHGLNNLARRFKEVGGICEIQSTRGVGTSVHLSCRLPGRPS